MGEYRAVRDGRKMYDVALVVKTPRGQILYPFHKQCKTMKEAKEIANVFNSELGITW